MRTTMETISAYRIAKLRGTDPATERGRCGRGLYGPLAGEDPVRVYLADSTASGYVVPKTRDVVQIAQLILDLLLAACGTFKDPASQIVIGMTLKPVLEKHGLLKALTEAFEEIDTEEVPPGWIRLALSVKATLGASRG